MVILVLSLLPLIHPQLQMTGLSDNLIYGLGQDRGFSKWIFKNKNEETIQRAQKYPSKNVQEENNSNDMLNDMLKAVIGRQNETEVAENCSYTNFLENQTMIVEKLKQNLLNIQKLLEVIENGNSMTGSKKVEVNNTLEKKRSNSSGIRFVTTEPKIESNKKGNFEEKIHKKKMHSR